MALKTPPFISISPKTPPKFIFCLIFTSILPILLGIQWPNKMFWECYDVLMTKTIMDCALISNIFIIFTGNFSHPNSKEASGAQKRHVEFLFVSFIAIILYHIIQLFIFSDFTFHHLHSHSKVC